MPIHAMDAQAIGSTPEHREHVRIAQCLVPMAFDKYVRHSASVRATRLFLPASLAAT